jgi:peptidoglycan hydrolase CwlO-like protein
MRVEKIWNKYKSLKWYYKILLLIPFLLVGILSLISLLNPSKKKSDTILEYLDTKTSQEVRDYKEISTIEKQIRSKIDEKIKESNTKQEQTEREINNVEANLHKQLEDIDSIDNVNDLRAVMAELNKRARKTRTTK